MPDQTVSDLATVWTTFFAHLQGLKNTSGPNSSLAFRAIAEGEVTPDQYPEPSLIVQLIDFEVSERANNAKIWTGRVKLRVISLAETASGATVEAVDKIGQVDDHLDSYTRPDGVMGFEDGKWAVTHPTDPDMGGRVICERVTSFKVNVARSGNQ